MKKAIFILVVLIFSFLYATGLLTRGETLPFSRDIFSIESLSPKDRVWDLKKINPIDPKELEQLYQLKLEKGIRNLPALSSLLIREADQAKQRREWSQAIEWADYSIKFSPQHSQPYFELARIYWHQNPFQLNKMLSEIFKGQIAAFRYYPSSLKLYYNIFYILSSAILMTFMIFGMVVMIKYFPLYFYDIHNKLTPKISNLVINGLKIFLLLVPFFLRLDILWAILFWSIPLWDYVTKRERYLLLAFLIIVIYIPFSLRSVSSFLDSRSSEVILKIHQMNDEDWDRATGNKLRDWLLTQPDDPEVLFTLGLNEKRQAHYPQAEAFYKKVIQKDPQFSETFLNLGNVYLAQKQTHLAIPSYQQAIHLNPHKGVFYYNLYLAYSQENLFAEKTDKTFQKARQVDPDLVDSYLKNDSPNIRRLGVDEVLTTQRLWRRFLTQCIGREGFLFLLFKAWFEPIPSRVPSLVPLLFLIFLIAMVRYSRKGRFLNRCQLCGSPTYRYYFGNPGQEFFCFNCYQIFVQQKRLYPPLMKKKSLQVRQFQKSNHFIGSFLSFFFVGFKYLWGDQSFKGVLLLFFFFVFIFKFLHWDGVIPSSVVQSSRTPWGFIYWGALLIIFYCISLRQSLRMKSRFEAEIGAIE